MQSPEILKKRRKEAEKKRKKKSIYDSALFNNIKRPTRNKEKGFNLLEVQPLVDQIFCSDSRNMDEIISNSVSLVITSPPYDVNKDYNKYHDNLNLSNYLEFLDGIWKECFRILRPGGRLCINIANIGRSPYLPLSSYIFQHVINLGFFPRAQIIWDKNASAGSSTAWGSWKSSSNPTLRDVHEYIMIFSKTTNQLKQAEDSLPSDITRDEFLDFTKSIWAFNTESPKKVGHPAPFPEELPYRCIKLYSYPGDLIVDPFCGSGTTCKVAKDNGRHYIGYDIDPGYIEIAKKRLSLKINKKSNLKIYLK